MDDHLATVQHGRLVLASDQPNGAAVIEVGSPEWFTWVETADAFAVDEQDASFIAHRMHAGESAVWLGFSAINQEVREVVLGAASELTRERLRSAAGQLVSRRGSTRALPAGLVREGEPLQPQLPVSSP